MVHPAGPVYASIGRDVKDFRVDGEVDWLKRVSAVVSSELDVVQMDRGGLSSTNTTRTGKHKVSWG